jgi:transcriptional regulator with XRE-family HTH domain
VKVLRTARGWSREHLAQVAGVTSRTIDHVESGRDVRLSTAIALASALDVTLDNLLDPAEVGA